MIITLETEFGIGDVVYHKTDISQSPYIITSYEVSRGGVIYICSSGGDMARFYDFELSVERDTAMTMEHTT